MRYKFKQIIPYIMVLISFLVLLFGEGIMIKFFKPQFSLQSTFFKTPSKLDVTLKNKIQNKKMPSYIRVIKLKNTGVVSSNNLSLTLKLDGEIYDLNLTSREKIKNIKRMNNNIIKLFLPRLARNANVELTVWMKDNNSNFEVTYADEKGSGEIIEREGKENGILLIRIIMIVILFGSLGFLGLQKYREINNERIHLNNVLLQKFVNLIEEFDEIEKENSNKDEEIDTEDDSEKDFENIKTRIENFVEQEEG